MQVQVLSLRRCWVATNYVSVADSSQKMTMLWRCNAIESLQILQSGLEMAPALPHKECNVGSSPTSATKLLSSSNIGPELEEVQVFVRHRGLSAVVA